MYAYDSLRNVSVAPLSITIEWAFVYFGIGVDVGCGRLDVTLVISLHNKVASLLSTLPISHLPLIPFVNEHSAMVCPPCVGQIFVSSTPFIMSACFLRLSHLSSYVVVLYDEVAEETVAAL